MGQRTGHGKSRADHRPSRDDLGRTGLKRFSSQAGAGSREENASKQKALAAVS
jgi:hypothetical protein